MKLNEHAAAALDSYANWAVAKLLTGDHPLTVPRIELADRVASRYRGFDDEVELIRFAARLYPPFQLDAIVRRPERDWRERFKADAIKAVAETVETFLPDDLPETVVFDSSTCLRLLEEAARRKQEPDSLHPVV